MVTAITINKSSFYNDICVGGDDIISQITKLSITKEQFENSIPKFINEYKRLPYMEEDNIEVEIKNDCGKIEVRPYVASKYIKGYYGNQDNMTKELFDKKILSYDIIAEVTGLTRTVVENTITKSTKNPEIEARRMIHLFFNKDFYSELNKYNARCSDCSRRCKQYYYATMVVCPRYKKRKNRKKK